MWKVGEQSTMKVACNPKSNFPISIELRFGGPQHTQEALDNSHGMWFDVSDAKYLIAELEKAVTIMESQNTGFKRVTCIDCGCSDLIQKSGDESGWEFIGYDDDEELHRCPSCTLPGPGEL